MRWPRFLLLVSVAMTLAAGLYPLAAQSQSGAAQGQVATPKPYKPVAVTPPKAVADPSFEAFRKQLGDIAARKDKAALAALVAPGFFRIGDEGKDKADKKKSGIDNLAAAIELGAADGSGWDALAAAASDPSMEAFPQRQGVMCGPAMPTFDDNAFQQLLKGTGTEDFEWGYTTGPVDVRSAAAAGAPVSEKIGTILVRILPDDQGASASPTAPAPALRIVPPSGKTGYVSAEAIRPLGSDQLCYMKDGSGWKIAGYIGGE
jgi:hypothetical protein